MSTAVQFEEIPERALTLWRPWPYTFTNSDKRIENRKRPPWASIIGKRIMLHAGMQWDSERWPLIQKLAPACPSDPTDHPTGIFAVARVTGYVRESTNRWWLGPVAWTLSEFVSFEPVPCKGAQGMWRPSDEVLRVVCARWTEAVQ